MNLLSTGNVFTEVSLDTHGQTLIVGENGAGKSTILDALSFVLYGKSFRKINKPQLVNTINEKNLLVECDFSIGNRTYKVRRGIKPTVFEIYIDGSLLNQDAESVDYQDVLEKQILKLNHKTFSQVVVLGSASFVPFMQLAAQPRRDIIEDLLDIQVFTTMNTLLKEKIATNKNNLVDVDYRISNTEDKINIEKQHLSVLEQNKDDLVKQKTQQIDYYIEQVKNANSQATTLLHEITELQSTINDQSKVRSRQEKILTLSRRIDINLEKAQKDEEFFKAHDNCPTCRQGLNHARRAHSDNCTRFIVQDIIDVDLTFHHSCARVNGLGQTVQCVPEYFRLDLLQVAGNVKNRHRLKWACVWLWVAGKVSKGNVARWQISDHLIATAHAADLAQLCNAITKLHFVHFDAVIGYLLFDPTLKAQHLHDWISSNSRWDVSCIAPPNRSVGRVCAIVDFWLLPPVSNP